MSDFETYHQKNNFIDLDFPVFLSESTIVYNKSTGENQLINVFGNIGKTVNAILIEISLYDLFDRLIDTIEYTYEGINFWSKSYFGDKVSIPISPDTRKVEVNIVKVICANGTVIESKKENTVVLSEQNEIKDYPEEFLSGIEKDNNIKCRYYPKEYENAWQCSCGIANSREREMCRSCGAKRETVETICEDKYLDEKYVEYKKQKEIEEEERKQREIEEERERKKEEEQIKSEKKRTTTIIVCIVAVVIICAGVLLGIYFGTQNSRQYNKAEEYIKQEQYNEAYEILSGLAESGYKDSQDKLEEIEPYTTTDFSLKDLKDADTMFFGTYEQDNDRSDGKEPIEWIIANEDEDGQCTLVSKYCLDVYTASNSEQVKKWLKEDFMNEAFSYEEKDSIISITLMRAHKYTYSYDILGEPAAGTLYACRNEKSVLSDCRYWLNNGGSAQGGEAIPRTFDERTFYVRPAITIYVD